MQTREYESPCGYLLLGALGSNLCHCDWMVEGRTAKSMARILKSIKMDSTHRKIVSSVDEENLILDRTTHQLDEYFSGERHEFELPLLTAGTEFQQTVWKAISKVPYGTTTSYKDIAAAIGRPSSVRAVANAVGANSLSIIIPCHRIVGSDGSLTGYAGGTEAKRHLLALEIPASL